MLRELEKVVKGLAALTIQPAALGGQFFVPLAARREKSRQQNGSSHRSGEDHRERVAVSRRPPRRLVSLPRHASTSITKSPAFAARRRSPPRLVSAAPRAGSPLMGVLKDRIAADLKEAMRARIPVAPRHLASGALRLYLQALGERSRISDNDSVVRGRPGAATRRPSCSRARAVELADKERREREILLAYLPAQRSAAEIREIVQSVLAELPEGSRNIGAVMKVVMPQLREGNRRKSRASDRH